MDRIIQLIAELGVIPVVKIEDAEDSRNLADALLLGGLPLAEITFRTGAAEAAIAILAREFPELLVGAGTILTSDQASKAVEAGARFIVSPGYSEKVVEWCRKSDVLVIPGVSTPTEIMMSLDYDLTVLKFFPADILGGPAAIKAIGAAFPAIKFIPTGGISAQNLPGYLSLPMVLACGGSWMVKHELVTTGNFEKITALSREAREIVIKIRGQV